MFIVYDISMMGQNKPLLGLCRFKANSKNIGKRGKILKKYMLKDWNLVYLAWQNHITLKEQLQTALDQFMLLAKDQNTLIEQSLCYKIL